MRIGKVSENILKRSVIKNITYQSDELVYGPAAGGDCSRICVEGKQHMVFSTNPVVGSVDNIGRKSFCRMMNDIVSEGAVPSGLLVDILLPEGCEEKELKCIMEQLGALAAKYEVDILGGHTEVCSAVTKPVLTITGTGFVDSGIKVQSGGLIPGQDIVMTKWAGASGAAEMVMEKRSVLEERFSTEFLNDAEAYIASICCAREARIAVESGAAAMHNVSANGVFGALWEMGEASGAGLQIDLKKIPIRQETVEICEFFDYNPYMISSQGALLIGIGEGDRLVHEFERAGIVSAVIGHVTRDNDRTVINGEERRFLVPSGNQ